MDDSELEQIYEAEGERLCEIEEFEKSLTHEEHDNLQER